jgi:hypothetical protein
VAHAVNDAGVGFSLPYDAPKGHTTNPLSGEAQKAAETADLNHSIGDKRRSGCISGATLKTIHRCNAILGLCRPMIWHLVL